MFSGISEWTGRLIAWLTLAMVLIMFGVVVLRYGFDYGSIAIQESVTYLHAFVFMLGAAYTLKHDEHVRVDILYRRFGDKGRAAVDLFGTLFLLVPVSLFLIVESWDYVGQSWKLLEGSKEAGGLDLVFLLKTAIPALSVLLLIEAIARIANCLIVIGGGTSDQQAGH